MNSKYYLSIGRTIAEEFKKIYEFPNHVKLGFGSGLICKQLTSMS
jgi:hypothetical protein